MQEILSKKKIGQRIKTLRLENKHSQAFIAKILNISRSNYSQIELGNQYPSFDSLSTIASYYSKSYDWLLHGIEAFAIFRHPSVFFKELPMTKIDSSKKVLHVNDSSDYVQKLQSSHESS